MRACVLLENKTFSPELGETFPDVMKAVGFLLLYNKTSFLSTFYIQL